MIKNLYSFMYSLLLFSYYFFITESYAGQLSVQAEVGLPGVSQNEQPNQRSEADSNQTSEDMQKIIEMFKRLSGCSQQQFSTVASMLDNETQQKLRTFFEVSAKSVTSEKTSILNELHETIAIKFIERGQRPIILEKDSIDRWRSKKIKRGLYSCYCSHEENPLPMPKSKRAAIETFDPSQDHRKHVPFPYCWPYATHGKLLIDFPSQGTVPGTAFAINKQQLLTAGHCAYDRKKGGWARKIKFLYPKKDNNSDRVEWCPVEAEYAFLVTGWTGDNNYSCDYAMLTLKSEIELPEMNLPESTEVPLKDLAINVAGYPHHFPSRDNGSSERCRLYTASGYVDEVDDEGMLIHNVHTGPGQSGSAIWVMDNEICYFIGIHTQGDPDWEKTVQNEINTTVSFSSMHREICNKAVWISPNHLKNILEWRELDVQ